MTLPPQKRFMDIQRPTPPSSLPTNPTVARSLPEDTPVMAPKVPDTTSPPQQFASGKKPHRFWRMLLAVVGSLLVLMAIATAGVYVWYQQALQPVTNDKNAQHVRLTIKPGTSPQSIARELEQKKLIRSALAFQLYTRLQGEENQLQAGVYNLSPTSSAPSIAKTITSGKVDTMTITFLPGATLSEDKKVLQKAGYNSEAIDAAFAKQYDSPLFAGKPNTADLEGYIYGQTYQMPADASVEDILRRTFDEFTKVVRKDNLEVGFKQQGLTLYQGITLASIVQREAGASDDRAMIAGIFFNRLKQKIPLGSDVTYQYIADKTGQSRDPSLDSPYNTRRYPGLPPGPIATPGENALKAVAAPAQTEYIYFLSGDDNKMHYAKTEAEHEQNKALYCKVKCQII